MGYDYDNHLVYKLINFFHIFSCRSKWTKICMHMFLYNMITKFKAFIFVCVCVCSHTHHEDKKKTVIPECKNTNHVQWKNKIAVRNIYSTSAQTSIHSQTLYDACFRIMYCTFANMYHLWLNPVLFEMEHHALESQSITQEHWW